MNEFILFILIGFGSGIFIFPVLLWFFNKIRSTLERRKIKRMLKKGQFLITIDPKDYNVNAWKNQKYGNINTDETKLDLERLNEKIFKKSIESTDDNFMIKIKDYIKEARKIGYSDEKIRLEFRNKSYTEDLINKIFEENE